jgi:site-specific DNA-methyltransferase (adenine-specific)
MNTFITTEILKCHIQSYTGLDELDYKFNSYTGDTLDLKVKESLKIYKFDAVIGNPPYSTDPSKRDNKPLYNKFTEQYIDYGKLLLFVVPSKWFVGGKGVNEFRAFMMKRRDIKTITHEDDSKRWFGNNIEVKGGVNYFLKDESHNGDCNINGELYNLSKYDSIIMPKYHGIIDVVIKNESMKSLDDVYMGRCFGIETNDKRLTDSGNIKCYVSSLKSKDRIKYIDEYEFTDKNTFWKVVTPTASHKAFSGFGDMYIAKPNEIHSGSYISFKVNSEEEAKSLLSYMKCQFANHLLSVRKVSQIINKDTCKWIPLVPLDRMWNDDTVCEYLKIDKKLYM